MQHLTYFYCFPGKAIVLSFDQIPQQQHLRSWPERKEEGYVTFNYFCILTVCMCAVILSFIFINLMCFVFLGIDYREKAP